MVAQAPKLIIGLGHLLRRDDGVGVHAAETLQRRTLPADVEIYDAGSAGWELPLVLEGRALVVVIDSIDAGATPGAVFRLSPEELRPALRSDLSIHDFHLLDALDETRLMGTTPDRVVIYAIQPADISSGIGLTPAVESALERTIPLVLEEIGLAREPLAGAGGAGLQCRSGKESS